LELLVDGGASASWVGVHLSAIRTAFDKMCGRQITSGLMSPRRPKRLPVVLSQPEVLRLLEAAPSLRDKLLLDLMYATGLRSSEVAQLKWRDSIAGRRGVAWIVPIATTCDNQDQPAAGGMIHSRRHR
jgi:integrase